MTNMTSGIEAIPGICGAFKSAYIAGEPLPVIDGNSLPCGYLKGHEGPHTWELCGDVHTEWVGLASWSYRCDLKEGHGGAHGEGGVVRWPS